MIKKKTGASERQKDGRAKISSLSAAISEAANEARRIFAFHSYTYVEDLNRLIESSYLHGFWIEVIKISEDRKFITELLVAMAAKGGIIPKETLSAKKKRRRSIAQHVKRAIHVMKQDDILCSYHVVDLLNLAGLDSIKNILNFRDPSYDDRQRDPHIGWTAEDALRKEPVTVLSILLSLENALENFEPLNDRDDVTHTRFGEITPTAGITNGQQRLFERQLCKLFKQHTEDCRASLVAEAVSVVFSVEADAEDIAKRYRMFLNSQKPQSTGVSVGRKKKRK